MHARGTRRGLTPTTSARGDSGNAVSLGDSFQAMKPALRLAALFFAILLVGTACGGDDSSDAVASLDRTSTTRGPTEEGPSPSDEEAVLGFTQCMRDQGVDLPDPRVDSDGNLQLNLGQAAAVVARIDQEVLNAAFLECEDFLEGVSFGFDASDVTAFEDRLLRFAECMRANGVDLPDPDFSNVGQGDVGDGPFGALDLDDPLFQGALDVCGDVLAGFGDG